MLKKICAWGSGALVVLGLIAGGIGVVVLLSLILMVKGLK